MCTKYCICNNVENVGQEAFSIASEYRKLYARYKSEKNIDVRVGLNEELNTLWIQAKELAINRFKHFDIRVPKLVEARSVLKEKS